MRDKNNSCPSIISKTCPAFCLSMHVYRMWGKPGKKATSVQVLLPFSFEVLVTCKVGYNIDCMHAKRLVCILFPFYSTYSVKGSDCYQQSYSTVSRLYSKLTEHTSWTIFKLSLPTSGLPKTSSSRRPCKHSQVPRSKHPQQVGELGYTLQLIHNFTQILECGGILYSHTSCVLCECMHYLDLLD